MHIKNLQRFGDIQRGYLWSVRILDNDGKAEDLTYLAKECSWQGRTMEPIESMYMGMKVIFPGKIDSTHEMTITFEEYESQKVSKVLYRIHQKIFDVTRGHSNAVLTGQEKNELAHDIKISLRAYNGDELPVAMMLRGAFLKDLNEASLNYEGSDKMPIPSNWSFDWWEYVDNVTNKVIEFEEL